MTSAVIKSKLSQFISDQINLDAVEVGFNFFLTHKPDLKKSNKENVQAEFIKILQGVPQEPAGMLDLAVKQYVNQVGALSSTQKISPLLDLLQHAVNTHVVSPRMACEAVLNCDKLDYENATLWIASFKLVRQVVGGVDYKGVREIMKNCIEKAHNLPAELSLSLRPQVEALTSVLEYIFDRNAALLPGYFIVNEILKSYPETSSCWPHWSLVPLVAKFLNSFRPAAAIVSCTNLPHLSPVVEYLGRANVMSTWKLEPTTLKFLLKQNFSYERILPYHKELTKPQTHFLRYLLTQTYSKDLINHVLSLKKPAKETPTPGLCVPLQKQMVVCLLELMRMAEQENQPVELLSSLFRVLSADLIHFVLYSYISFPAMIHDLGEGLAAERLTRGRDKLMWVLLQFISGSIQKNPSSDFMEVLQLYRMYDETEPLAVPDTKSPDCIEALAAVGILVHLKKKVSTENKSFGFPLPIALAKHLEFLESASNTPCVLEPSCSTGSPVNYLVPLLCNSFSTTTDLFQAPMQALVDAVGGSLGQPGGTAVMPGVHVSAALPVEPLPMALLDSLSVHSKMSLLHHIVTHILKMANTKSLICISPGMVETYSRLLVYSELESLGIKGFMSQLLPKVFSLQAWSFLYTLLEIFSYRVHHVQNQYKLNLLTSLNSMATHAPNQPQLNLMLESACLRLITGMGNFEMTSPKPQPGTNSKASYTLYGDSEELNRMVILTLARTIHIGGMENNGMMWLKEVVSGVMQNTPHSWPSHTLKNFPQPLLDLLNEYPAVKDTANIKKNVDEDWNYWNSLTNEQDKINHFCSQNMNHTFLCLLWKMIFESEDSAGISPAAYQVLERIGAKQMTAHLRTFCEYLVIEFSKSAGGGHVSKSIDATNTMIWKYNLITLDRLVLCMVLRPHEGDEAQVCFFIIQVLLLKPNEFRKRVNEFCRTMNPDHHLQQDWHEKHLEIHQNFPEKFAADLPTEEAQATPTLPIYYGNVCLRFIPVFDVVVHRFLELLPVQKSLETMFTHLGCLYKFHDKPITYLYNTLHYYENILRNRPSLRRLIVSLVDQALKDVRPPNWAFTQEICSKHITTEEPDESWRPGPDYFFNIVGRMVCALDTYSQAFPHMDWRFNEFPNEGTHGMYVSCVELMVLPMEPHIVGEKLVDVILQNHSHIPLDKLPEYMNVVGILLSNLPSVYWEGLHNKIEQILQVQPLSNWNSSMSPTEAFDFSSVHCLKRDTNLAYLLAVVHSTWHHAGFNQLCGILELVRDKLIPLINNEEQMLYLLHLVGPFLQRLHTDRFMRVLFDLTIQLYELLLRVDRSVACLKYADTVCDLLYHIKYQFTGDSVKADAERVVKQLRPALQLRLRFIAQVPIKTE